MSRIATLLPLTTSAAELPEFEAFRTLMVGVAGAFSQPNVLPMLNEFMHERALRELATLTSRPDMLLRQLEQSGDVLLLQILKANLDFLSGSATITNRFKVPRSTLHREKDLGRVIAYRPTKEADFIFPHEQFSDGKIAAWAEDVIRATDNGGAALHFLYVPREQLGGDSFAAALRNPRGRDVPALIKRAALRLSAE